MAIKAWIEVLRDKYHPFNEMSIQRLAALGSQASDPVLHDAAIDALVEYRMGQTGPLRHSAMQALEKLGWKPGYVSQAAGQTMPNTAPLHTEISSTAPFISFDEEHQRDWNDPAEVAYLATMGNPGAVTALGDALRRGNLKVHMAAARALARIGTEQALSELIDGLEHEDWIMVTHVAEVLGETNNPIVIIPLIEKLSHPEGSVRRAAAQSLVAIYRNARLKPEEKQLILNERERMAQPFESHPDPKNPHNHIDTGIGIKF